MAYQQHSPRYDSPKLKEDNLLGLRREDAAKYFPVPHLYSCGLVFCSLDVLIGEGTKYIERTKFSIFIIYNPAV